MRRTTGQDQIQFDLSLVRCSNMNMWAIMKKQYGSVLGGLLVWMVIIGIVLIFINPEILTKLEDDTVQNSTDVESSIVEDDSMRKLKEFARGGSPFSQYRLARSYYNGDGVQQDYDKAIYWFERSAAQGYIDSKNALARIPGYLGPYASCYSKECWMKFEWLLYK